LSRLSAHWWIALVLIVADQITKALVHQSVGPYDAVAVIPGLVDLVHVRNEGVAFGLLNQVDLPFKPVVTSALALAALGGIVWYARHLQPHERLARLGLACILGGAIGNLIDRVRQGYVLDFVDVYWNNWHFWAFNVADASITIGAILVFADLLLVRKHVSDPV
jgi:signal peptidase II